ncbi:MAG: chromosome segregation protein SMC [Deltaproteobacteria bacterium]|nr:chromosome segregation protein SMC [Deltaproteobacteria bacterium]
MKLKRLSLLGFKSFFKSDNIVFDPRFNCIIGSNGCGKSNLIDALRWVCGETRPSILRVNESKDLIFLGSKKSKPLGMAQVSLLIGFDTVFRDEIKLINSDTELASTKFAGLSQCSEIEITRRIYADGEQEFLINNVPVRLKDIKDLTRTLGLTFRSCSTIGQGEIDKIVELKPEDLKTYIEDSCGLTEIVEKLKDTKTKLSNTETNLKKLVEESEGLAERVAYLTRIMGKFEKAKKSREELLTLLALKREIISCENSKNLGLLDNEIKDLAAQKKDLEEQVKSLEEKHKSLLIRLQDLKSNELKTSVGDLHQYENEVDLRASLDKLMERFYHLSVETYAKETELSTLKEKLDNLEKDLKNSLDKKQKLVKTDRNLKRQLRICELKIKKTEKFLEQLEKNLEQGKVRLDKLVKSRLTMEYELKKFSNGLNFLRTVNLGDEALRILSLFFPGFIDIKRFSDELDENVLYLKDDTKEIKEAVDSFISNLFRLSKNSAVHFDPENFSYSLFDFVYRPSPKSLNPWHYVKTRESLLEKLNFVNLEVNKINIEIFDLESKIDFLKANLEDLKFEKLRILELAESVNNKIQKLETDGLLADFKKLNERIESAEKACTIAKLEKDNMAKEIERIKEKLSLQTNSTSFEQIKAIQEQKDSIQQDINECLSEIIRIRNLIQELELKISTLERQKWAIEYEAEVQFSSLLSKYSVSENELPSVSVSTDIQDLDFKIERKGKEALTLLTFDENLLLEHDELTDKFNRLKLAIEDITMAKEELLKNCRNYESEYESIFYDYFSRVRNRFNDLISRLFSGASGVLRLDESGVHLEINFKNKKGASLNQLSGGEKSLLSLSFLCALAFEAKSPVLIFDEVDAPLDDFNAAKLVELVKDLKETCQIICVTHNKITMLASDRLIGVTLHLDGYSEVLSLTLEDMPLEAAGVVR